MGLKQAKLELAWFGMKSILSCVNTEALQQKQVSLDVLGTRKEVLGGMIQHLTSMCAALGSISSLQGYVGGGCPVERMSAAGPATCST